MKNKNLTHSLAGNTTGKNTVQTVQDILKAGSTVMTKVNRIKRIYEDDDFIIDLITGEEPIIRVSIFKDNHFQDEVFIRKEDYIG